MTIVGVADSVGRGNYVQAIFRAASGWGLAYGVGRLRPLLGGAKPAGGGGGGSGGNGGGGSGNSGNGGRIPWGSWDDYPKVTVDGQEYAQVGSRLYSHHAVDRMQPSGMRYSPRSPDGSTGGYPHIRQTGGGYDYGRGVAPRFVEDAIATSPGVRQPNGNISHTSGTLQVILSPEGRVVSIITH